MARIDARSAYLALAVVALGLSYLLFTNQQYFSVSGSLGIFAIALVALVSFLAPSRLGRDAKLEGAVLYAFAAIAIVLAILSAYEFVVDVPAPNIVQSVSTPLFLVSAASVFSIIAIHYLRKSVRKLEGYRRYAAVLLGVAAIALIAYFIMYAFVRLNWHGVDELAFNYYASYLFVHGQNPYTTSMEYITTKLGVFPTVLLNGSYEYTYDYPALSFIVFAFIPLLGITSFMSYIAIVIFLSLLAAYIVYDRSGGNNAVLLPMLFWFMASYGLIGVVTPYLAVSMFVLLAYLERRRVLLSGALLGLAASTTQLAWFALPLMYILALKEHGMRNALKCAGMSALVFLIVNVYFIAWSPNVTLNNLFVLLLATKLPFYGTNIMQFLVPFYPVSYWYPTAISVITILSIMVLFYLDPDRFRPLVGIMPAMIFFLSWRNISIYGLSFVPLILAVYYSHERKGKEHRHRIKARYALAFVVVASLVLAAISHDEYLRNRSIAIDSITPVLYPSSVYGYQNGYALGELRINVSSNADYQQNVSFYIVSQSPNLQGYVLSVQLPKLPAHESVAYNISYRLPLVNNHTKIFVTAFDERYIASKELDLTQLR
ncbi:MAG: hypothetical protein KGH69_03755 [Candidatus Micrarchaeota archaeon]|nr:hypothetical protein [Candidatus Micrarchaeota archaeon]